MRAAIRRARAPKTLRRQLTVMLVLVVSTMAVAIVLLSAIPLRNSLVSQLDTQLRSASARAVSSTTFLEFGTLDGAANRPSITPPQFSSGSASASASDSTSASASASASNSVSTDDTTTTDRPPGLGLGQSAYTISVFDSGSTIQAGYYDTSGEFHSLAGTQIAALTTVPTDAQIHSITIPDLGSYRAISTTDQYGSRYITALPMTTIDSTVGTFVLAASIGSIIIVLFAAFLGALLIKRALTPLSHLADTAQAISRLPLEHGAKVTQRVPENVPGASTEVIEVSESVNAMLAHIDSAFTARDASENKLRSFVADASHELRTPLASVRGYAELMGRDTSGLTDEEQQSLSRIQAESKRMARLVEDLLLLARLDNERPLESIDFDGVPAVIEAVADAHVTGPTHVWHLNLDNNDDDEIEPVVIHGDPNAFRQIVVNLVANARIHTPGGTAVRVILRQVGDYARLTVTDNGPGIEPEIRDKIFDRFVKADASRTPGKGSSGLGLSIVAALAKAQGGSVDVRSTPGDTVFEVNLPLGDPDKALS